MKIKKGDFLRVNHIRKGHFNVIALEDFDTEKSEFYPVGVAERVVGSNNEWLHGEEIPCRRTLCNIELIDDEVEQQ